MVSERPHQLRARRAGDEALLVEFGDTVVPLANERAQTFAEAVRAAGLPGVRGVTAGYLSVLVEYDSVRVEEEELLSQLALLPTSSQTQRAPRHHVIPVHYGGSDGPDLDSVATATGLTPDEVVALHAGQGYRVYCLGFSPGFPLCAPLPEVLRLPRRSEPRTNVLPGSVAIAGMQTGIYPLATSGGWHLIGRTPVTVFSWDRPDAAGIRPGDTLQFRAVGEDEYLALMSEGNRAVRSGGALEGAGKIDG